jgi:hypothetical protein
MRHMAGNIGWGFSDYVSDVVAQLHNEPGDQ